MNRQEIISFINANLACFLGTAGDGVPHVRGMLVYRADDSGIIFHTGKMKDLYKQLQKNPKVELCFFSQANGVQVRVSGTAELVEDLSLKQEIAGKRDFLKSIAEEVGYENIAVYRVRNCKATTWTMATNLSPKEYVTL